MEQIRSFIAIELPQEVQEELGQMQSLLKSSDQSYVKWVDPHSIHLTLKFLGNVAATRIDKITRAMEVAAQGVSPLRLELTGPGAFPNLKRVQVIWVGLGGDVDKLKLLQQRIESNVAPLGFPTESRPFAPHLTLARLRDGALPEERQKMGQAIGGIKIDTPRSFTICTVSLMKSELTRQGAIYTQLYSIKLSAAG